MEAAHFMYTMGIMYHILTFSLTYRLIYERFIFNLEWLNTFLKFVGPTQKIEQTC